MSNWFLTVAPDDEHTFLVQAIYGRTVDDKIEFAKRQFQAAPSD